MKLLKSLALASLLCFTTAPPIQAGQDSPYELLNPTFTGGAIARLPVSIIAGRLVITCDVSTAARRLPANLFIDFESPSTLKLHNQAADGLRAERGDGSTIPITVHLPGLEFGVQRRQIGDDKYLDRFTKWHSIALGETAVIGTLGSRVLEHFTVTFDLAAGELMLEPKQTSETAPTDLPPGTQTVAIEQRGGLIWIPARVGGDEQSRSGVFALGSGAYDSTIDWDVTASLGRPAGDLDAVRIGDQSALDIAGRVALRPSDVPYAHPDGALGVLGLGFLENFRVEIDRSNNQVYITPTAAPDFPAADRALFAASWNDFGPREDADSLEAWLEQWCPAANANDDQAEQPVLPRLAPEAARDLLELRLYDGAASAAIQRALEWTDRTTPKDLRATGALEVMDLAASTGSPEALVAAGTLGVAGGRDDRYPDAVHKVHAKMGATLFELERLDEAWRHLLSAAFGEPENGPVNLGLGRYYEAQARQLLQTGDTRHAMGRFRRAFSRYLQAAIKPDSGPAGVEALERVQKELMAGQTDATPTRFGAELVERLIAGKVRNFGAPSKFEETTENSTGRVVLVEFFTNAFYGTEARGGAIGGGLAQEGLQQHFNDDQVAFLSYHLPVPALDPLVNQVSLSRAEALGVKEPNVQVVDGTAWVAGAGKWRDAEEIYSRGRKAIESALQRDTDFAFELDAQIEADTLSGSLLLDGPMLNADDEVSAAVHLILAERRVIFPGPSGIVIHRMVARAELTPPGGLIATDDPEFIEFDFESNLVDLAAANSATLDGLVDGGAGPVRKLSIDFTPNELVLVAFVSDLASGQVQASIVVEPETTDSKDNQ